MSESATCEKCGSEVTDAETCHSCLSKKQERVAWAVVLAVALVSSSGLSFANSL